MQQPAPGSRTVFRACVVNAVREGELLMQQLVTVTRGALTAQENELRDIARRNLASDVPVFEFPSADASAGAGPVNRRINLPAGTPPILCPFRQLSDWGSTISGSWPKAPCHGAIELRGHKTGTYCNKEAQINRTKKLALERYIVLHDECA